MSRSSSLRIVTLLLAMAAPAAIAQTLPLDGYLEQVAHKNKAIQGLRLSSKGQQDAAAANDLVFGPQLTSKAQFINDPRTPHAPRIDGNRKLDIDFQIGVRQQTSFGLQYQAYIEVNRTRLFGVDPSLVTYPDQLKVYFIPELQLSLWQNWLGSMVRASHASDQAKARATALGDAYHAKGVLVDAEGRYWKLAVLREILHVERDSIDRVKDMLDAAQKKLRRHLGDRSDVLVAEAAVKGKMLELAGIEDEARAAASAFNAARGVHSDEVHEDLVLPSPEQLLAYKPPASYQPRGDVQAAEQGMIAAQKGYEMARQKLLPELNLYGSIYAVGLNLTLPLEFGTIKQATRGFSEQRVAAQLQYEQKQFEAQTEFEDLVHKLKAAQDKLELAMDYEQVEQDKFEYTRKQLATGLTVQAQVIQYELEYLQAVLARVHAEGDILGVETQFQLYGSEG